ncbi:MAG: hypothetical protein ABH829_05155 [archaeon]
MELTLEEKSLAIHASAGALMGAASGYIGTEVYIGFLALGLLFMIWYAFQRAFKLDPKTHGNKWWFGVGVWPYMIFWLFVWALVYYAKAT